MAHKNHSLAIGKVNFIAVVELYFPISKNLELENKGPLRDKNTYAHMQLCIKLAFWNILCYLFLLPPNEY